jgi:hypothetical protein
MPDTVAAPETFTAGDVLAVLALEEVAAAVAVAPQVGVAVDVALLHRAAALAPRAKLVRSARFSYRAGDSDARGAQRSLAQRAPHAAVLQVPAGGHAGAALYQWVALRRRVPGRR